MAFSKQAEGLVVMNLKKLTSVADFLVVCSASSEKQVQAIAEAVSDGMKTAGERPLGSEGVNEGRWALVDCDDVIVHVFLDDVRHRYDLEGLWADAPRVAVADKTAKKASAAKPVKKAAAKKPAKGKTGLH